MSNFNEEYADQLREYYPRYIVNQITDRPRFAPPSEEEGVGTPYVKIDSSHHNPYAMYIPGFGEGIVNKASFAAELADQDVNVILPGQNRKGSRGDAVDLQAENYLDVIGDLYEDEMPSVYIAHSFGAQVLEQMVYKSPLLFKESQVILLAPSGSIPGETYPSLAKRWLKFMRSESDNNRQMEFPDPGNVTSMASTKTLLSNPRRTAKEIKALRHGEIDYSNFRKNVGSLSVVSYAKDAMFPSDLMIDNMSQIIVENGEDIRWVTPFTSEPNGKEDGLIGVDGATHDDEQFNPTRVVDTIVEILDHDRVKV